MARSTKVVALMGLGFIAVILLAAVFAPILSEHPPNTTTGLPFEEPSANHLLGTDDLGRDLWSQLLFGARISLSVGLIAAVIATTVGTVVALLAGYRGGTIDAVLMRITDLVLSLPFLVLVLVLVTYFGAWTNGDHRAHRRGALGSSGPSTARTGVESQGVRTRRGG